MSQQSDNGGFLNEFAIYILLLILAFGMWFAFKKPILHLVFDASPTLFEWALLHIPRPLLPDEARMEMARWALDIPRLDVAGVVKASAWKTFTELMYLWGVIFRLPLTPIFIALAVKAYFKKPLRFKYAFKMSLKQLAMQNAKQFPCTLPAIRANILERDEFKGQWRYPLSPIDFAVTEGLLLYKNKPHPSMADDFTRLTVPDKRKKLPHATYMSLDLAKADAAFIKQLGPRWKGLDALEPLERALAVCFMASALGGKLRDEAFDVLDNISRSYIEAKEDKTGKKISKATADDSKVPLLRKKVENNKHIKELIASHAYVSTVFMRLYDRRFGGACGKGKLAPNTFLWLRPHNEWLWRILHAVGGQEPWQQGAAAWVHFHCEIELKRACPKPIIEGASDSLKRVLYDEKWITDEEFEAIEERESRELLNSLTELDKETKRGRAR